MAYLETLNSHPFHVCLPGWQLGNPYKATSKIVPIIRASYCVVRRKSWENHVEILKSSRTDLHKIHL